MLPLSSSFENESYILASVLANQLNRTNWRFSSGLSININMTITFFHCNLMILWPAYCHGKLPSRLVHIICSTHGLHEKEIEMASEKRNGRWKYLRVHIISMSQGDQNEKSFIPHFLILKRRPTKTSLRLFTTSILPQIANLTKQLRCQPQWGWSMLRCCKETSRTVPANTTTNLFVTFIINSPL